MQFFAITCALFGMALGQHPGYIGYQPGFPTHHQFQGYQGYQGYPGYPGYPGFRASGIPPTIAQSADPNAEDSLKAKTPVVPVSPWSYFPQPPTAAKTPEPQAKDAVKAAPASPWGYNPQPFFGTRSFEAQAKDAVEPETPAAPTKPTSPWGFNPLPSPGTKFLEAHAKDALKAEETEATVAPVAPETPEVAALPEAAVAAAKTAKTAHNTEPHPAVESRVQDSASDAIASKTFEVKRGDDDHDHEHTTEGASSTQNSYSETRTTYTWFGQDGKTVLVFHVIATRHGVNAEVEVLGGHTVGSNTSEAERGDDNHDHEHATEGASSTQNLRESKVTYTWSNPGDESKPYRAEYRADGKGMTYSVYTPQKSELYFQETRSSSKVPADQD